MRSVNSIKNAIIATVMNIVTIVIGFIAQKIFIQTLGTEYLGINGLFTNILSMLGIIELGLGSAIIYHLYKPIAKEDKEKIKSLLLFYKIGYRVIGFIIAIIGLLIIPFLHFIVGKVTISENIIYIYLLFLMDIVVSYLLTYKRSILYANQKTYVVNLVHIAYLVIMNVTQLTILILTKNYILYLWIKIICRILENIVITIIANHQYPYIKDKNVKLLEKDVRKSIFTKVKGLVYHKIGSFVVLGSDNIIISTFLGVVTVGLYSNYNLIIQALNNLFSQVFNSITASVGNLLIESDKKKSYSVYKNILFLNSWMYAFASTGLLCVMEPFVKVWIGSEFLLPFGVLITLVINFYSQGMRKTSNTFKEAAGIFYEDRFVPLWESLLNIVASVILVKIFGLMGVFIGTIISTFVLFFYSYPQFVYKPLFERTYIQYIKDYIPYLLGTILSVFSTYLLIDCIQFTNSILQIVVNVILVIVIPNMIHFLLFYKTEQFKYYKELLTKVINKK
ncbi:MAG: polysaccharide transporter [Clostridia bacterium]|nr:polysaccharide transporter [Clostridia bacterium]